MLDKTVTPIAHALLRPIVYGLNSLNVRPDHITLLGFVIGLCSAPLIYSHHYYLALGCIAFNRICDGIDGELARLQQSQSDAGGFLDICLDFVFYASVPLAFVCAAPQENALAGATLLFAFMGTGSSFLAFAIMAEKRGVERIQFKNKSFYYINGLAEGTETIAFFVLFCLLPQYFAVLAWVFSAVCVITTCTRIAGGYKTLI